jgi:hypothetical protein
MDQATVVLSIAAVVAFFLGYLLGRLDGRFQDKTREEAIRHAAYAAGIEYIVETLRHRAAKTSDTKPRESV